MPGEAGIWAFIFGEMTLFLIFFATYLVDRRADPALFDRSQLALHRGMGVLMTLLLLTSSLFVLLAVGDVRSGHRSRARRLILAAAACGVGFGALKVVDYTSHVQHDITPGTNEFYLYYFLLTGIHMFHVTLGLGVLGLMWGLAGKAELTSRRLALIEAGGCFWHMVDVLWIILFPLIYLLR